MVCIFVMMLLCDFKLVKMMMSNEIVSQQKTESDNDKYFSNKFHGAKIRNFDVIFLHHTFHIKVFNIPNDCFKKLSAKRTVNNAIVK